jgi:predicted CopG family antitoxin
MASKTINVSSEAYDRLARLKQTGESFTDVINRLTGKHRILDLVGLWDDETADEIEGYIKANRKEVDDSLEDRYNRMVE